MIINNMSNILKIKIKSDIFPIEAYYATSLFFLDKYYVYLDKKKDQIEVIITPKEGIKMLVKEIEGDFRNELINNSLRIRISQNNLSIRQYIINQALFSSLPTTEQKTLQSLNSYQDDPLGIAIPWEEKYPGK